MALTAKSNLDAKPDLENAKLSAPVWIVPEDQGSIVETFNTNHRFSLWLSGRESMIEVYAQIIEGTWFAVALNNHEIVTSSFGSTEQQTLSNILSNLPYNKPFQIFHQPTAYAKTALNAIKDIYDGKDIETRFTLAITHLPHYTKKVLKATLAIPVGYVTSYGAIAKAVGGGPRAVGNTMACNLFPPVVPCHRVVKSDLGLGGYGAGGLGVKLEFLRRERRGFLEPKDITVAGGCLKVFPVEQVLEKYA